jgi:hypothetical protein
MRKNEIGEDIEWKPESAATYSLNITAPVKGGQVAKTDSHSNVNRKDEQSQVNESGYVESIVFGEGGTATYNLSASGNVTKARIVRMHSCEE